jgi:hypothetical protein
MTRRAQPAAAMAWAVKRPDGSLVVNTTQRVRRDAITLFCGDAVMWQTWKKRGYRVVRVRIEESRT